MNPYSLPYSMIMWAPFYITIGCLLLLLFTLSRKVVRPAIRNVLCLFFGALIVNWLNFNLVQYASTKAFAFLPLYYFSVMALPVLLYHFIWLITRTGLSDRFSRKHYILPITVGVVALACSFYVRYDMKAFETFSNDDKFTGNESFILFHKVIFALRAFLALGYFIPIMQRIRRYRKAVVNFSSDETQGSVHWLNALMYIFLFQAIAPLIAVIVALRHETALFSGPVMPLMAIAIIFQNTLLIYNALLGNFVSMSGEESKETPEQAQDPELETADKKTETYRAFKVLFETYLAREKPYLQSDLKITELAQLLGTNRTYLSSFINNTYKKNFCRFINDYRVTEYERLKQTNTESNNGELLEMSGFTSYKNYQRAKQAIKF